MRPFRMSIRGKLLAVHFYLAFLGTAYILYKKGEVLSNTTSLVYEASLLLTGLSIWFVWSWKKLTGNWFDPYVVFLIAACLFNGGHAYLEVFGLNKSGILDSRFSPATSLNTLLLVILGLSCFHFGAMAAGLPCVISDVVPEEADITTRSVKRMSLENHSSSGWADIILQFVQIKSFPDSEDALSVSRFRQFDINTSVEALAQTYHGAV